MMPRFFRTFLCAFLLVGLVSCSSGIDRLESAVVRVVAFDREANFIGHGTGFVVSSQGHVVTNHHVIKDAAAAAILLPSNSEDGKVETLLATLVSSSRDRDLAVLKIDPGKLRSIKLSSSAAFDNGTSVWAIGFPGVADDFGGRSDTLEPTMTAGATSRDVMSSWSPGGEEVRIIQHTAAINGGNSGGPLMNRCGHVVGVNTARPSDVFSAGIFLSVHSAELRAYLSKLEVPFKSASICVIPKLGEGGLTHLASWLTIGIVVALAALTLLLLAIQRSARPDPSVRREYRRELNKPQPPKLEASTDDLRLDLITAEGQRHRYRIDAQSAKLGVTIGRSSRASVTIPLRSISKRHARLSLGASDEWRIEDLGSTNGTWVNGERLELGIHQRVRLGDRLSLGKQVRIKLSKP